MKLFEIEIANYIKGDKIYVQAELSKFNKTIPNL